MANVAAATASGRSYLMARHRTRANASLVPLAIIGNKKIGPGAKLVYTKLLTYASTNQMATNRRLAADLAVSPRSVRNYITALKSARLVRVHLHPGKPSSYRLTPTR